MEEPWVEEAAHMLEKYTGDPLADAVRGTVRVVSASDREGRARYQACQLEVVTTTAGIPETRISTEVVTSAKYWPRVGSTLPALISPSDPTHIEINWDALARQ
ncbi:hypothetical protein [Microbacterium sp. NPDC076895]|uniref:hypothetical protein n=1 Tax=Microbacterium sp. NPDC076895 TaxID=3154957 RepID=UPI00342C6E3F